MRAVGRMARCVRTTAAALMAAGLVAAAMAQPPGGFEGAPGPGASPGAGRPPHRDPIRQALDANHDHQLDADEIRNASTALAALDKNGDGIVNHDDLRPPGPPNRDGRGPEGGPRRGRGGPDGPEGRGPGGPRGPGPSPERFIERLMSFDADGDGKLDRDELRTCAEQMRRPRGGPPGTDAGPAEPPPPPPQ